MKKLELVVTYKKIKTIYTITKACFFFFLIKECLGSGENESEESAV